MPLFDTHNRTYFLLMKSKTGKTHLPITSRGHFHAYVKIVAVHHSIGANNYPSARDIGEKAELSRRTVFRYLDYLRELGAPLDYDRKKKGYYFTDPHWQLPPLMLSEGDLLAFFIAEQALRKTGHSPQAQQLRASLSKLAGFLPAQVSVNLSTLGTNVSFQSLPFASAEPDTLELLVKAAVNRQIVEFDYFSPHSRQSSHRTAGVLLLHNFIGDWFAISFDQVKMELRDFHAGRMKNLKLIEREAVLPEKFDAEDYLKQGFYMMRGGKLTEVNIHFDSYQAQWIRERASFHPEEKREDLPDGSLRLSFKIGEMGLEAVARFCLTYAGHCRVEAPPKLKEIVREKLQKGLNLHQ